MHTDIRLEDVAALPRLTTVCAYLAAKATSLDVQERMPFRVSPGELLWRTSAKGAR